MLLFFYFPLILITIRAGGIKLPLLITCVEYKTFNRDLLQCLTITKNDLKCILHIFEPRDTHILHTSPWVNYGLYYFKDG